jgi:hypothetical protein
MNEVLACQKKTIERIKANWGPFLVKRRERLVQRERNGSAAEKVAENIVEDLLTTVLDWPIDSLNHQLGRADIVLTRLGIKHLVIEVKRPGSLVWNVASVHAALEQARGYADRQNVRCVAVSDGEMFYAADIRGGGLDARVWAKLDDETPPESLWWLGVHGIYRERADRSDAALREPIKPKCEPDDSLRPPDQGLLHRKYHLPARCFAYVGDSTKPSTWKLPYRLIDGSVDKSRLPKAIQAILTNYRGAGVRTIPEKHVHDVLSRLREGAAEIRKTPEQTCDLAEIYRLLDQAVKQRTPEG